MLRFEKLLLTVQEVFKFSKKSEKGNIIVNFDTGVIAFLNICETTSSLKLQLYITYSNPLGEKYLVEVSEKLENLIKKIIEELVTSESKNGYHSLGVGFDIWSFTQLNVA